ncbi:phospholipase domain-containing protein, partial [uncultured Acinetobacter sp.]
IRVCYDINNGNAYVDLLNISTKEIDFILTPLAYRTDESIKINVKAQQTVTHYWDLGEAWQWYDFAVTCSQDNKFYRRFAGRVEIGKDSVSDPAMV